MQKESLERLTTEGLSLSQISERTGKSATTIRYWIKKHGLKLLRGKKGKIPPDGRVKLLYRCKCGETDRTKFYGHKRSICGKCHGQYTIKKGQEKRSKALEFLGGRCKRCGYDEFGCSLDVHHLDPSKKDPNFGSMRGWGWKRIEKEIKNCILLCKNCHGAVHTHNIKEYLV